ncbi:hypothetical protein AMELA_G00262910 [Ameiurus melas]|uniref:Uncharacterized protein n=1 Tax=Ameiurus melas TaxID=219545 RepID=A0A7J5ZT65_AMEME|nr:hypothetical protein AMELA_G00262910 [Ameiurus melas]
MRPYLMLFLIFPMPDVLSLQVPCTVNLEEGVEYRKITWYKVSVRTDSLVGLVMKDIRTNTTHLYKFANHSYQVGNDLSLLHVPERSQNECEKYRCCVWPPVGHRILQSDYSLPQGCQSNNVGMTELSVQLQHTNVALSNQFQCIIIGVLLFVILSVTAVVCLCKQRKTHTKVPLFVSI